LTGIARAEARRNIATDEKSDEHSAASRKIKSREGAKARRKDAKRGEQNVWREDGRDARKDDGLLCYLQRIPFASVFAPSRLLILLGLIAWKENFHSLRVFRRIVAQMKTKGEVEYKK
jgi:hypothetical protein